ncbi:MAG: 4a-hydroxytetrahydrobiopterin dehydratase [Candidatus Micrarchaeota archaeon]|nr:4a-hydroxytetrahydrobiopterin dehydratase [Candidatus Micrarchaeota archaeon]MDE1804737.1 4a-hydroxytetrahydrobiopterin dehydratase [Candidatus Micrarchaeota archaeon]MDE1847004.1 4a-hydroxytetrahydrobiopterin dehydratase [Candidatus Micrarchaeota archaeon]
MKMSDSEVKGKLRELNNWQLSKGKLHKEYKFETFEDAVRFIDQIAVIASSINHHPEIYNVYNRVTLELNTHDEGGITEKDFNLAKHIDGIS